MGIKDEFHQKVILSCIEELLHKQEENSRLSNEQIDTNSIKFTHNLNQHSFSTLERCGKCNKYLRGLLHQGLICQDCGLVAHRTCASTGLPTCTKMNNDNRMLVNQTKITFGRGLCLQFSPLTTAAPEFLIKCVLELEKKAKADDTLELYSLYCTTPPADQMAELLGNLEKNNFDLSEFSAVCIANVIKKYLRELPDPVIPVQWYDEFFAASSKDLLCFLLFIFNNNSNICLFNYYLL